jgi:hypothetical protein
VLCCDAVIVFPQRKSNNILKYIGETMTAIDKVKKGDRLAVIHQYARDITKGTLTIGSFEDKAVDAAECKRHF